MLLIMLYYGKYSVWRDFKRTESHWFSSLTRTTMVDMVWCNSRFATKPRETNEALRQAFVMRFPCKTCSERVPFPVETLRKLESSTIEEKIAENVLGRTRCNLLLTEPCHETEFDLRIMQEYDLDLEIPEGLSRFVHGQIVESTRIDGSETVSLRDSDLEAIFLDQDCSLFSNSTSWKDTFALWESYFWL